MRSTGEQNIKTQRKSGSKRPTSNSTRSTKASHGSRQQWACAEVISRLLSHLTRFKDLHPVFAILLYPLGGIAGYGNMCLETGDMHTAVSVHAIVHDAFGYVDWAHNVGPSYNYLAREVIGV